MQPCTVALFHVPAVGSEGSCPQLPAPGPVMLVTHFQPAAHCLHSSAASENSVSALWESCAKGTEQPGERESWLPELHGLSLWTDNNLLQGKSHLWCMLRTRYEIPKTGMEPRNKLIISFFSRQHSDTYDKISWANFLPKSKLAIHSVTTVTWISEHRHSSQTVEPWKTHGGVELITN